MSWRESLYSTLFREGDVGLGRWWSRDPLEWKYPENSPYTINNSNPIINIDLNGDDFGYYLDHTEYNKSITIVMNIYTISENSFNEATNGAKAWNKTKIDINGYTVSFQVNIVPPIAGEDYNTTWDKATSDPIGNLYASNEISLIENSEGKVIRPGSKDVEGNVFIGGTTWNKRLVTMNTHKEYGNLGFFKDLIEHEFGHLFGLEDNEEGNNYFPGVEGIMEYVKGFNLNEISKNDIETIIKYINDFNSGNAVVKGRKSNVIKLKEEGADKDDNSPVK